MTEKERKISPEKEKEKDIPDKKGSEDEDELGDEEEDNEIFAVEGADKRKRCNIVFIGHVDSGKSTTCGHILQLKKMVDQRTMEKNIRESEKKGTEGQKFAFILDELEQERARGKTWECGHATFTTETKLWYVIDAPGHRQFIAHTIGGASLAEVAVLIVSARRGEFEAGFQRDGQTREHIVLARTVGVQTLIIAVNKMDEADWDKKRYDEIKSNIDPFLRSVGWKDSDCLWVPISGFTGDNLIEKTQNEKASWYSGPPLLDILENLRPPERLVNAPALMSIQDKYKAMGSTVVLGKIECGTINEGDELLIQPGRRPVEVVSIECDGPKVEIAEPGDQVKVSLHGIDDNDVRQGYCLCSRQRPIHTTDHFEAQFMIMECPNVISAGFQCVIHSLAAQEEAIMTKLLSIVDKSKKEISKAPAFAKAGQTIMCRFKLANEMCMEPFKANPQFARFIVRSEGRTIGIGMVTAITTRPSLLPIPPPTSSPTTVPSSSSPTTGVIESQSAPIVVSGPKSKISLVGELPAIKESKTKLRQQKYQEEKERQQQQQQMYQRGIRGKENPMQYQGRGRQMNQQRTPGNRRPDFTPPKGPNPWGRGQGSDVNNQPLFNLAPMQQWESADYYNQLNYNFMMGSGQAGGLGGWGINIQNEQQQQMRDLDELERQLLQQEEEIRQQNLIYEQQMLLQQQQENAQGLMGINNDINALNYNQGSSNQSAVALWQQQQQLALQQQQFAQQQQNPYQQLFGLQQPSILQQQYQQQFYANQYQQGGQQFGYQGQYGIGLEQQQQQYNIQLTQNQPQNTNPSFSPNPDIQQQIQYQQPQHINGQQASDPSQQFAPSPQLLSNPTQPIQFTQSNPGQNTSVILNQAQTPATAPITSSVTSKALSAKAKAFVPGFLKKKDPEPKKEVEQKLDETGDVK